MVEHLRHMCVFILESVQVSVQQSSGLFLVCHQNISQEQAQMLVQGFIDYQYFYFSYMS